MQFSNHIMIQCNAIAFPTPSKHAMEQFSVSSWLSSYRVNEALKTDFNTFKCHPLICLSFEMCGYIKIFYSRVQKLTHTDQKLNKFCTQAVRFSIQWTRKWIKSLIKSVPRQKINPHKHGALPNHILLIDESVKHFLERRINLPS